MRNNRLSLFFVVCRSWHSFHSMSEALTVTGAIDRVAVSTRATYVV
jgi:hypothetical protein